MRNQGPYLVFLDFFVTMIGAFAVYSTNFIAFSNAIPILGSVYGISIVIRGFLPLLLPKKWLFKNLPIFHLTFLALIIMSSILLSNIVVYLVGITISVFLGMFTGSYIYNLEITWSKNLKDASKFFSVITGVQSIAFLIAPILTYLTPNKNLFLSILLVLIALVLIFLAYFRFFSNIGVQMKFFSGNMRQVKKIYPIIFLASFNWFLQYLWMGVVFALGVKQGIPDIVVLSAVEGETILYIVLQFGISIRGFMSVAKIRVGYYLIGIYIILVTTFVSLDFYKASEILFVVLLFSFAVVSVLLEPLVDTLLSASESASENSTLVVAFRSIGGGIGYAMASFLLII